LHPSKEFQKTCFQFVLANVHAFALRVWATIIGIFLVASVRPTCGKRFAAASAFYEMPKRKIRIVSNSWGIQGRNALAQMIQDVESGEANFSMILVYDVSRWGRFQDTDESAHYEYICRTPSPVKTMNATRLGRVCTQSHASSPPAPGARLTT